MNIKTKEFSPLVVFLAGVVVWVAVAAFLRYAFPGDFVDDGQYLVSARSLCDHQGYRLPSRPGSPVATKYPIGTSAIAAVLMTLLPGEASTRHDWLAGKIVVLSAGVILAIASRRFFILSGFSHWVACSLSLAVIWHPEVFRLTGTLMSDVPYAAISTALLVRWLQRSSHNSAAFLWAIDGLLAGIGWQIRGNGITLVAAAFLAALFQKSNRYTKMVAVMAGVACTWIPAAGHIRYLSGPRDTGNYLAEMRSAYKAADHSWSLPVANVGRIPSVFVAAIVAPTVYTEHGSLAMSKMPAMRRSLGAAVLGLLALGVARVVNRRTWPLQIWIHAISTLLIFVVWWFPLDNRFALPLSPLVLAACAFGLETVISWRFGSAAFGLGTTVASVLIIMVIAIRSIPQSGVMGGERNPSILAIFEKIRVETTRDSVVICPIPELVYLNTGRVAVPLCDAAAVWGSPPSWEGLRKWLQLVGERPIYLMDAPFQPGQPAGGIEPLLADERVKFELIAQAPASRLWRVIQRPSEY